MQTRENKYQKYREELEKENNSSSLKKNKKVVMNDNVSFSSKDDTATLTSALPLDKVMSLLVDDNKSKNSKKKIKKQLIIKIVIYSSISLVLILLTIGVIFLGIYAFK